MYRPLSSTITMLIFSALLCQACSTTRWEKRSEKVRIDTSPAGATVWYQDETGQHQVGSSPVDLEHEYEVGIMEFNPLNWLWASISVGTFAGSSTWAAYAPEDDDVQQGFAIGLAVVGGLAVLTTLTAALSGQLNDEQVVQTRQVTIDVGASMEGHTGSKMTLNLPTDRESLSLLLHPTGVTPEKTAAVMGTLVAAPGLKEPPPPVVAVFDIHDASGRFSKKALEQLTAYLATSLTEAKKARVVPREQIRNRLKQNKAESYDQCYEESCQIELGRALAAEKSLSTTLLRVGKKCALTANFFDLKSETAERGATVESDCKLEALMAAAKKIAAKI